MSQTITRVVTIESTSCGECGIQFGLESRFMAKRLDDGQIFHCPNGHKISWAAANAATAEKQRLRNELEAARSLAQRESQRRATAQAEARTADYKARAAKGQLTKTRKRVAAGVCPCCNRTFQALGRHMASQHPEYVEDQP